MTVTVISIIAVIVVLAVLLLLLLGMRALNLGSRSEEQYDDYDEYEYDDEGDEPGHDPEEEAPRGRRSRQGGGRKSGPRKQRQVDWGDDEGLSDNDFWSSLSEEGPAQTPARERGHEADDRDGPGGGAYGDEGRDGRGGPRTPVDGTDLRQDPGRRAEQYGTGPAAGMAALADLGQESGPQQSHRPAEEPGRGGAHQGPAHAEISREERSFPSSAQETHGPPPHQPTVVWEGGGGPDPLGSGRRSSPSPELPALPSSQDPLGGPGTSYHPGGSGDGAGTSSRAPYGSPFDEGRSFPDPGPGTPFDFGQSSTTGTHARSEAGGRPAADPLDPGFRSVPDSAEPDTGSPIWSSMDSGTHQRPDPSVLGSPVPPTHTGPSAPADHGGPGSSGGTDDRSGADPFGAGPPFGGPGQGSSQPGPTVSPGGGYGAPFERGGPEAPTRTSPFDGGAHGRAEQGRPPWEGTEADPYGLQTPPHDTGSHTRPPLGQAPPWGASENTGSHTRPWDTGGHTRPAQGDTPPWNTPETTGGHTRPAQETDPYGLRPSPHDTGSHTRPDQGASSEGDPEDTGTHTYPGQGAPPWETSGAGGGGTHTGQGQAPPWGAFEAGAHQHLPRGSSDDTGGYTRSAQETDPYGLQPPPHDTGSHTRPDQGQPPLWSAPEDTGPHARPPYSGSPVWGGPENTGSHTRPDQGRAAQWEASTDTGGHTRPWYTGGHTPAPQSETPPWNTPENGDHAYPVQGTDPYGRQVPPHDTGSHARPATGPGGPASGWQGPSGGAPSGSYGTPGWGSGAPAGVPAPPPPAQETDPYGRQVPPYDTSGHMSPDQGQPPLWGTPEGTGPHARPPYSGSPAWGGPENTGSHTRPWGTGGHTPAPQGETPLWNTPETTGGHTRPAQETDPYGLQTPPHDTGTGAPGGLAGYPYQVPPTGAHPADPWSGPAAGHTGEPSWGGGPDGRRPDMLDGSRPGPPSQHGAPAPSDGWGGGPAHQDPADPYQQDPYGRAPLPPEGYYEGGYEDGRFR